MNHQFHRHSTRYSRTSREVLEALDKNWMDQPHYEPITWQLGSKISKVGFGSGFNHFNLALRLLGMSWGVKTTCLEAPGVSLGGSGVSIGGVGSLRVLKFSSHEKQNQEDDMAKMIENLPGK